MNLMEAILNGNGSPLSTLAKKFGIDEDAVTNVVQQFIPALTNGVKRNVSQPGGLDRLLQALNGGNHDRYLDNSKALEADDAVDDGNGILGHLFGSKKTSRELANRTAKTTGLSSGILKQMLPLIAGLVMGSLKKQGSDSGLLSQLTGGGAPSALGSLTQLLDADGDGSPIDDLLGFAKKLF